eukprot:CAMPEP_0114440904 /NCGR_PEP_ID=MMETSP0103-20121206/16061_1 /TAXON_ID=37642 ORGANISM="Paraphysomonas imperforata, Strain PA2" /NCGR_SAMPLE_ID=MMETSP0103 /ASSEMBLY_ACC=CAM_ASM_000201 /LENGTH=128 /DNA_ID=CAMNT_0001611925 /DNA_START=160 /DNA_END=548 /DNA_ORIENTATION=+
MLLSLFLMQAFTTAVRDALTAPAPMPGYLAVQLASAFRGQREGILAVPGLDHELEVVVGAVHRHASSSHLVVAVHDVRAQQRDHSSRHHGALVHEVLHTPRVYVEEAVPPAGQHVALLQQPVELEALR